MKKNKSYTAQELKAKMDNHEDYMLVDVLNSSDYHKAHIDGATNIPLNELEAKAPQWLNRNIDIVLYSANGTCKGAEFAQDLLGKMGYRAWTLEGGVDQWIQNQFGIEGDPNYKPQPIFSRPSAWSQPSPVPAPQQTTGGTQAPTQKATQPTGQKPTEKPSGKIIPFPQKGQQNFSRQPKKKSA